MSTYDPALLSLHTVKETSRLGQLRLGVSALGVTTPVRTPVPTSSLAITTGYEVGQLGELSIDPVAATGSISQWGSGDWPDTATPQLSSGDFVEVTYGDTVLISGFVQGTATDVRAATGPGGQWRKNISYSVVSNPAIMLSRLVEWASLPAEGALPRLQRWFTVDISDVPAEHTARLYEPQAARTEAGRATLLELAREFTARTLFTLAAGPTPTALKVAWPAAAPIAGTEDARTWTRAWKYDTRGQLASLSVTGEAADTAPAHSVSPALIGNWTPAG